MSAVTVGIRVLEPIQTAEPDLDHVGIEERAGASHQFGVRGVDVEPGSEQIGPALSVSNASAIAITRAPIGMSLPRSPSG